MKKLFLLSILILVSFAEASNFRDGMLAYKDGDFKKAKEFFERAIKDGAIQPYFMLGKMYLYGEGVKLDRKKAIEYLKTSSEKGNIRAKCFLAEAYLKDNTHIEKATKLLKIGLKRRVHECKKIARIYGITIK